MDVGIAQSGVEDLDVLAGYKAAGVDLFPIQMAYLLRIGGLMLLAAAGSMVLDVAAGFVSARTGAKIGRDLRRRLFARVVAFSDAEINRFSAASLITRGTNDVTLIQNVCTMVMRMVLYAPILAIGGVVMVMVTNPQLGWIVVLAVAVVFTVIAVLFRFTLPRFKIMQTLIDRVNLVAREMLNGLSVVRAFNREGFEENRFDAASRKLRDTQLFTNRAMAFMMPTMMLVMNLTSVAIVWFGAQGVAAGTMQTGDLIAFITYAMVIIMGCLIMGMVSIMLPRADVAAQRLSEVLATEPTVRDPEAPIHVRSDAASGARIAFNDVSFRYTDDGDPALSHVSFVAEPGTTLAIVGPTGSGKSSTMYTMIRECAAQGIRLDRDYLVRSGEAIELFPGVREWFARITAYGADLGVDVEHYVISSGLREIIEGSGIAHEFKQIYACEFYYDESGLAAWPKLDVNFTNKTQFVYRINKGILDIARDKELNDSMPDDSKRVPFTNMVYVGDGLSDVPCMKMMRAYGGQAVAVYQKSNRAGVEKLLQDGRVDFIFPADYREGTEFDKTVHNILRKMAVSDALSEKNAEQLRAIGQDDDPDQVMLF